MTRAVPDHLRKRRRRGEALGWLRDVAMAWESDDCLLWPYYDNGHGYPEVWLDGKHEYAHRVITTWTHGDPPDDHEARHRCGTRQCVNPRHLTWSTKAENEADKIEHGTLTIGDRNGASRLTVDDVRAIRRSTQTQRLLAAQFGVCQQTISHVRRRSTWRNVA